MSQLANLSAKLCPHLQGSITMNSITTNSDQLSNAAREAGVPNEQFEPWHEVLKSRGKKLSQIVAQSWLPGGENYKEALLGDEHTVKEFLIEQGIFDDKEEAALFDVDVKRDGEPPYYGKVGCIQEDPDPNPHCFLVIPYPDRPPQVTDQQLSEWVNDEDPNHIAPSNPYIPATST